MPNQNDRKTVRKPFKRKCILNIQGQHYEGMSNNMSLGGVFIEQTSPALPVSLNGESGEVIIYTDTHRVVSDCQIRHVGKAGIGLCFLKSEQKPEIQSPLPQPNKINLHHVVNE